MTREIQEYAKGHVGASNMLKIFIDKCQYIIDNDGVCRESSGLCNCTKCPGRSHYNSLFEGTCFDNGWSCTNIEFQEYASDLKNKIRQIRLSNAKKFIEYHTNNNPTDKQVLLKVQYKQENVFGDDFTFFKVLEQHKDVVSGDYINVVGSPVLYRDAVYLQGTVSEYNTCSFVSAGNTSLKTDLITKDLENQFVKSEVLDGTPAYLEEVYVWDNRYSDKVIRKFCFEAPIAMKYPFFTVHSENDLDYDTEIDQWQFMERMPRRTGTIEMTVDGDTGDTYTWYLVK